MTGIGPVPVKVPRVRDRGAGEDKITFTPSILPRYLRKAKSVEELLPWLYLKGVSTGNSSEALEALLGPNAKGLSAKTITRVKSDWWEDYEAWQKRDLGARQFLYLWADGVYFKARMADLQSDRKYLCHRQASNETHQRMHEPQDRTGHGLQADDVSTEEMAQTRRSKSPA